MFWKKVAGSGSTSSRTTSGSGGMVSLIGWIVITSSCKESILTTTDEPRFVETTCVDSSISEDDVALEVLIVLVSVE